MPRRLAREQQHAAGPQHAQELGERALELGQVVQHRVAQHEVERPVLERERGRVREGRLHLQAEPLRVVAERLEHAGRDVGADRRPDHARLHQVEREVPGARPDLQRAPERAGSPAEQLLDLAEHLGPADVAEVDAPLRVVVGGRDVVVAAVDVEDLVGRVGRGHAAASLGPAAHPWPGAGAYSPRKPGPMICCFTASWPM